MPMLHKQKELKAIYIALMLLFVVFLFTPVALLFAQSFQNEQGITFSHYTGLLQDKIFWKAFFNSVMVSGCAALSTTILAFLLGYTIHFTNLKSVWKKQIRHIATMPMLLPTITYGFAIIYTFGKQGLFTKLFGIQLFDIYGFCGLLIGYIIYTLPIGFLLMDNTMKFIDKKFDIVSRIMQDTKSKRLWMTIIMPMIPTLAASFIQSFFLSFTDFGIPASVGGEYDVVATLLFQKMLGSVPDFHQGALIAVMMLLPSIFSIFILHYLERFQIKYNKSTVIELPKNKCRDYLCFTISVCISMFILSIFAVIFLLPFMNAWPYACSFTISHVIDTLSNQNLIGIYRNSLFVSLLTALFGTMIAYSAALTNIRSQLPSCMKKSMDVIHSISNTIPGMVLGIAYLLAWKKTPLQNTFILIVICNIIHYFSTPYVMAKSALGKMNAGYETTGMLMGDSWFQTIRRVVVPNSKSTLLEMFRYYFVNAMVTISALIFIVGANTAVLTTKIKELQHFAKFDEIFVLSLLILFTNFIVTKVISLLSQPCEKMHMKIKKGVILMISGCILLFTFAYAGTKDAIVIYSNGDEEALMAMKHALDAHGYENQYILQSISTSELGGKMMAEGLDIEADIITMSSYYIDSVQQQNHMFVDITFPIQSIHATPSYALPLTALEGAIIINTKVIREQHLPIPASIKDLTKDIYKGYISTPDINASSTGWLLVQSIIEAYGETQGKQILQKLLDNVGPHLESSGSGPVKKLRSGEVAIAYGLRHQALKDKENNLPIEVIDPIEGNMQLSESIAVLDKEHQELAMEMANCIQTYARKELIQIYPIALYKGETADLNHASRYPKQYHEALCVELLKEHQKFFKECQNK